MSLELDSLHNLPLADKLRIVEELWDDIGASAAAGGLQQWHKDEARRRMTELEAAPESTISLDELWKRVEQRHG
jgi:putative addiction module component (TIGR02574 family)